MGSPRIKSPGVRAGSDIEPLLERYYAQLLQWGSVLTRGDVGMTREIVHDLCLHFTLTQPDLSQIENLDAYLYTCLRNIYLSAMARSSREALQFIATADFDSVHVALSVSDPTIALQRQNDLRQICTFALWRKQQSKSASYLILLFFHGYTRCETAQIARVPIATIYNKLKVARNEVTEYLEASGKLQIVKRELPPEPPFRPIPVSTAELFDELRSMIFEARRSDCLSEEDLIGYYRLPGSNPIPCLLLAHIVSCERCLALLDRHFGRRSPDDQEPQESVTSRDTIRGSQLNATSKGFLEMMRLIHEQRRRLTDHRPQTLSIAVNGRIVASHDVQSDQSTLSARIDKAESAQFVEVFTEQRMRLAFLPIHELPPAGSHLLAQRIALSDDRRLELNLQFDGQGLQSEVKYFDPALGWSAQEIPEDDAESIARNTAANREVAPAKTSKAAGYFRHLFDSIREKKWSRRLAWALSIAILCIGGIVAYRYHQPALAPQQLLTDSARNETAALQGKAEHRVLRIEETSADGRLLEQATVDAWTDRATKRSMRKLYNSGNRLLAAAWQEDGKAGSYVSANIGTVSDADRDLAAGDLWKLDLSADAFRAIASEQAQLRKQGNGYEVTAVPREGLLSRWASAAMVLNRALHPIAETLYFRSGSAIHAAQLIETSYELRPSASVPDSVFAPDSFTAGQSMPGRHSAGGVTSDLSLPISAPRLVDLQINVLYALHTLQADTSEPIEVTRADNGRIQVSGTPAGTAREKEIRAAIALLPDNQLVDLRLGAETDFAPSRARSSLNSRAPDVYDFSNLAAPAEPLIRNLVAREGLAGERANSAISGFSQGVLAHAQSSLQHAYALQRLADSFNQEELASASPDSQRKWVKMIASHADALKIELTALDTQIDSLLPSDRRIQRPIDNSSINSPRDFSRAALTLLRQVQAMNKSVAAVFASGTSRAEGQTADLLVQNAARSIPLQSSAQMAAFSTRLEKSQASANISKLF